MKICVFFTNILSLWHPCRNLDHSKKSDKFTQKRRPSPYPYSSKGMSALFEKSFVTNPSACNLLPPSTFHLTKALFDVKLFNQRYQYYFYNVCGAFWNVDIDFSFSLSLFSPSLSAFSQSTQTIAFGLPSTNAHTFFPTQTHSSHTVKYAAAVVISSVSVSASKKKLPGKLARSQSLAFNCFFKWMLTHTTTVQQQQQQQQWLDSSSRWPWWDLLLTLSTSALNCCNLLSFFNFKSLFK